jgi:hypothetical protein
MECMNKIKADAEYLFKDFNNLKVSFFFILFYLIKTKNCVFVLKKENENLVSDKMKLTEIFREQIEGLDMSLKKVSCSSLFIGFEC